MKKILLIIVLVFLGVASVKAQTYYPYVDINKIWSTFLDGTAEGQPSFSYFIKFTNDTTIQNKVYKKVMRTGDSLQESWYCYGFIRETTDKKVYFLFHYNNYTDTIEDLFYDFDINVGDTLNLYMCWLVVTSTDSVLIGNQYRKRYNFIDSTYNRPWIEGIGSLNGFSNDGVCLVPGGNISLLCFTENDTLKYINPDFNFCYQGTEELNEVSTNNTHVSVFPNPVSTSSVFEVNNLTCTNNILEIYSYSGQKLKTFRLDNQTTINKSDFSSGLYIYRLITKTKILTGKFEIE